MGPALNSAAPQNTGGASLAAGTYFYVVVAMFSAQDSMASLEISAVVAGSNNSAYLVWATVPGAVGYKIYRSTASGQYANTLIQTILNGAISNFLDTGYLAQSGSPVAFQLKITGQVSPAGAYQVGVFLSSQGNQAKQIDAVNTDVNGNFSFAFNPTNGTNEVYATVSGQRSESVYVNSYNLHLFLEMVAQEMLNNFQPALQESWITPQLYPSQDLFSETTIQSSDIDFQNAWGILTSVVNDPSIASQYRALVQAMVLSYRKATTFQALLDIFNNFQTNPNKNGIVFYDKSCGFRLGKTYLNFSVTRSAPNVPSTTFAWTGGLVNFKNKKRYVQAGSYWIANSFGILPSSVFVYLDGTYDANGYWIVKFDLEYLNMPYSLPVNLPNNSKVLVLVLTNQVNDIIDIGGNGAITSLSGPNGIGNGPYMCGPDFISRRARLNGRGYKYSRFLIYMDDLISDAPAVIQSIENLYSDMKPAKMTILFGDEQGKPPIFEELTLPNKKVSFIACDSTGYMYVSVIDSISLVRSIEKLNPDGSFNSTFLNLGYSDIHGVLYANNLIYVAYGSPGTVSVYNLAGTHQFDLATAPTSWNGIGGIAADAVGNIYTTSYESPNVLTYHNGLTGAFIQEAGLSGFGNMAGITVDPDSGNLYIVDQYGGHNDIRVFGALPVAPYFLFSFGSGVLTAPYQITIDPLGRIYVSDFESNQIAVFDRNGNLRFLILAPNTNELEGMTFSNNELFVCGNLYLDIFAYQNPNTFEEI
jgi:hypothetical protein